MLITTFFTTDWGTVEQAFIIEHLELDYPFRRSTDSVILHIDNYEAVSVHTLMAIFNPRHETCHMDFGNAMVTKVCSVFPALSNEANNHVTISCNSAPSHCRHLCTCDGIRSGALRRHELLGSAVPGDSEVQHLGTRLTRASCPQLLFQEIARPLLQGDRKDSPA